MAADEDPSQSLHGPNLRVLLTTDRDGECLLEITQLAPAPGPWRLEVVWQPVDARGLTLGFANPLYQTPLTFSRLTGSGSVANQLAIDKALAIRSLAAAGRSERQIAAALSVSRKAVRRHLGRSNSKGTKAPTGEAPTGSTQAMETKAPTGSSEADKGAAPAVLEPSLAAAPKAGSRRTAARSPSRRDAPRTAVGCGPRRPRCGA